MKHNFQTQLPHRSAECTITESLDAIYVDISCSNYENLFQDVDYVMWLLPILQRYEDDKRLIVITSPNSDFVGVIDDNGGNHISYLVGT